MNIKKYYLNQWTAGGRVYPHLDCWGLVCDVYLKELGIKLNAYTTFSESDMSIPYAEYVQQFYRVSPYAIEDYDIACWHVGKCLKHVGIVYNKRILHCDRKRGTVYQIAPAGEHITYYRLRPR